MPPAQLLIATTSAGKLREWHGLLGDLPLQLISLSDVGITFDVDETRSTLCAHALLKGGAAGSGGFGYDPVFYIPRLRRTLAEVPIDQKDRISHRGRAARRIRPILGELIESGAA